MHDSTGLARPHQAKPQTQTVGDGYRAGQGLGKGCPWAWGEGVLLNICLHSIANILKNTIV